jgi:hypothetical protein
MVLKWILRSYDINKAKLKAPEKSYVYSSKIINILIAINIIIKVRF